MTDADIRGHVYAISGAFDGCKKIEDACKGTRGPSQAERDKMEELKLVALKSGLELAMNALINLNDIAESLKFVATQHNNSEALFRG
jgi:hypothetical protein